MTPWGQKTPPQGKGKPGKKKKEREKKRKKGTKNE